MPSGVNVGGLNLQIGLDSSLVEGGLKKVEKALDRFRNSLTDIQIDRYFFPETASQNQKRYLDATKKLVQETYRIWTGSIDAATGEMSKMGQQGKAVAKGLATEYEKLAKLLTAISKINITEQLGSVKVTPAHKLKGLLGFKDDYGPDTDLGKAMRGTSGQMRATKFRGAIFFGSEGTEKAEQELQAFKGFDKRVDKAIDSFIKKITSNKKYSIDQMNKMFEGLTKSIVGMGGRAEKAIAEMGPKFQQAFAKMTQLDFKARMDVAKDLDLAEKKSIERVNDSKIALARLRTEIKAGINVQQNYKAILNELRKIEREGIELTKTQQKEYAKMYRAMKGAPKRDSSYMRDLELDEGLAKSRIEALRRRRLEVDKLDVAYMKWNTELKESINVEANQAKMLEIINAKQRLNARLTDEQTKFLAQHNVQLEKQAAHEKAIAKQRAYAKTSGGMAIGPGGEFATSAKIREKYFRQTVKLNVEERNLTKAMMLGFDVEKNRLAIIQNLIERRQILGQLDERRARRLKRLQAIQTEVERRRAAVDVEKKRDEDLKKLVKREAEYRAAIQKRIDVQRNQSKLLENLRRQEALGHRRRGREAWRYRLEILKLTRAVKGYRKEAKAAAGDSLFQITAKRIKWFVQLRAYWALYRGVGQAVDMLAESEYQLARAMRTARSETMKSTEILESYRQTMRKVMQEAGVGFEEVGEALYQLGSAGLTVEENLAALIPIMQLIKGTEGDVRDVTKAVAGIYNNYSETLGENLTVQEKMFTITDTIAKAWTDHQVEISEMVDGYKMLAITALNAGLSFQQVTGILATLNDHLIKGGRAGRTLRNVLSRMARQPIKFADAFGLTGEDRKEFLRGQFDLIEVIKKVSENIRTGTATTYQLSRAFERMGLRGADTFLTLVTFIEEVVQNIDDLNDRTGAAKKLMDDLLDTARGRTQQFVGAVKGLFLEGKILNQIWKDVVTTMTNALPTVERYIEAAYLFRAKMGGHPILQLMGVGKPEEGDYLEKKVQPFFDALAILEEYQGKKGGTPISLTELDEAIRGLRLMQLYVEDIQKDIAGYDRPWLSGEAQMSLWDFSKEVLGRMDRGDELRKRAGMLDKSSDILYFLGFGHLNKEKFDEFTKYLDDGLKALKGAQEEAFRTRKGFVSGVELTKEQLEELEKKRKADEAAAVKRKFLLDQQIKQELDAVEVDKLRRGNIAEMTDAIRIQRLEVLKYKKEEMELEEELAERKKAVGEAEKLKIQRAEEVATALKRMKDAEGGLGQVQYDAALRRARESKEAYNTAQDFMNATKEELIKNNRDREEAHKKYEQMVKALAKKEVGYRKGLADLYEAEADIKKQIEKIGDKEVSDIETLVEIEEWRNEFKEKQVENEKAIAAAREKVKKAEYENYLAGKDNVDQQQTLREAKTEYNNALEESVRIERVLYNLGEQQERIEKRTAKGRKERLEELRSLAKGRIKFAEIEVDLQRRLYHLHQADLSQIEGTAKLQSMLRTEKERIEKIDKAMERTAREYNYYSRLSQQSTQNQEKYATRLVELNEKQNNLADDRYKSNQRAQRIENRINQQLEERARLVAKLTVLNVKKNTLLRDEPKNQKEILKIEREILETNLQGLMIQYEALVANTEEYEQITAKLKLLDQMAKLSDRIKDNTVEQARVQNPIREGVKDWVNQVQRLDELLYNITNQTLSGFGSGIGEMFMALTGGTDETKQEIASLEDQIDSLNKERKLLQQQDFLTEDEIDRVREINREIKLMKDEIDDLEDPLKQAGEAFKDFFGDLITAIRQAINEWIAMQIVMGIVKGVGAIAGGGITGAPVPAGGAYGAGYASDVAWMSFRGAGGVIPRVKSFQSFSRGGMTGRPTMAVLGDNPSGKEIVIPEENIQSDSVSGYARDKGEIYIANFITQDDVAGAMASKAGKNVVLNHVMSDANKQGPTWKKLGR